MTAGSTSSVDETVHLHGRAHYRTTAHGPVVVVPTRCPSRHHVLTDVGYRIVETHQTLQVSCDACIQTGPDDSGWSFTTNGKQAVSAEFDDEPYAALLNSLVGHR